MIIKGQPSLFVICDLKPRQHDVLVSGVDDQQSMELKQTATASI